MHTQQQPREQCMDAGAFMHQFMCSNIPFHLHAHRKCIDCLTTKCANLLRVYEYEPTNTPYPFAPAQTRPICSQPRRMRYIAQKQTAATMDTPLKNTHTLMHTYSANNAQQFRIRYWAICKCREKLIRFTHHPSHINGCVPTKQQGLVRIVRSTSESQRRVRPEVMHSWFRLRRKPANARLSIA